MRTVTRTLHEHDPRNRSVPCGWCRQPTWNDHAVCTPCIDGGATVSCHAVCTDIARSQDAQNGVNR